MKNITPKNLQCEWGQCPALYEVTPADMKCTYMASCPAIFEQEDGILIIGKRVAIPEEIKNRVGPDEDVLWVPKGLLKDIQWSNEG